MSIIPGNVVSEKFIYVCPSCHHHQSEDIKDKTDTKKTCPNCNTEMLKSKFTTSK